MAHSKVFVHGHGPGVGDFLRAIANAGVTGTWKTVDNAGFIAEVCFVAVDTGVPQHAIMRWTEPGGQPDGDETWYELPPEQAAADYWMRVLEHWNSAPELHQYKDLIWIELFNELETAEKDDNPHYNGMHPVNWLGWCSLQIAEIANEAGFRVLIGGFNAGTPEAEDWSEQLGMAQFLKYCGDNPEVCGISLHEGYGDALFEDFGNIPDAYWDRPSGERVYVFPDITGRFLNLNLAAWSLGYAPPTTFITEWAWSYDHMPSPTRALVDVDFVAQLVNGHDNVKGVCLWNLDAQSSGGTIAGQMSGFLSHLLDYTLSTILPDPEPPMPEPIPPNPDVIHTIHLLPQDTTEAEIHAVSAFLHVTRSAFTYSADMAHRALWQAPLGSTIHIWNGQRWADDIFAWFVDRGIQYKVRSFDEIPGNMFPGVPVSDGFDSPVGTLVERQSTGPMWPGQWFWTAGFADWYENSSTGNFSYHTGHDLQLPLDADARKPIYAASHGLVTFAGHLSVWGNVIVIKHTLANGENVYTRYGHCETMLVSASNVVMRGQQIGTVGRDAQLGPYHLHYDVGITDAMEQNPGHWPGVDLDAIFEHYTNPRVFTDNNRPGGTPTPPPTEPVLLGLHASANAGGRWPLGDFDAFVDAKPEIIKVLGAHAPEDISQLRALLPDVKHWVVRAYLDWGERNVTPQQFVEWTLPDVIRTVEAIASTELTATIWIELHNEPNLTTEGLGLSWNNGAEFADWLEQVYELYVQDLPWPNYLFPGLSPGGSIPGIRYDSKLFMLEAEDSLLFLDGIGVHAYWGVTDQITDAVNTVNWYDQYGVDIIVTESSVPAPMPDEIKAAQYIEFCSRLGVIPSVIGVTYFVASGDFPHEVWTGTDIPIIVGQR